MKEPHAQPMAKKAMVQIHFLMQQALRITTITTHHLEFYVKDPHLSSVIVPAS